jgi:acyl-CoA hydrolase
MSAVRSANLDFAPLLRAGAVVSWPQGTGEPRGLTRRLVAQRHALPEVEIFIGMVTSDTLSPEHADRFRFRGLNGAGANRVLTSAGLIDIVPAHVSKIPGLLRAGLLKVDVLLLKVRPHTSPGIYTTGVIADFIPALVQSAKTVIAEIDERLPMTGQDALVRREDIDILTQADADEVFLPDPEPSEQERQVAAKVAELIPDGATVQLGVGGLPVAMCRALSGHRDLGIHSGVVPDGVVELMQKGVITNAKKGEGAGVLVTGGLFGTRTLFDFADGNREVELRSADYTHNPVVMARINRLYAINSAVEIDLTGQVNSEIAARRYLGAIGGQADFVRGAQLSPGGRAIIALSAATPDGKYSKIVPALSNVPVTTARADIDLVVTEYGVADLRGCSFGERARRLAAIAHPNFRDSLLAPIR